VLVAVIMIVVMLVRRLAMPMIVPMLMMMIPMRMVVFVLMIMPFPLAMRMTMRSPATPARNTHDLILSKRYRHRLAKRNDLKPYPIVSFPRKRESSLSAEAFLAKAGAARRRGT